MSSELHHFDLDSARRFSSLAVHRIAKRSGTLLASAGASPNTIGIVADTDGSVSTRTGSTIGVKVCNDGSTIQHLLDGVWATKATPEGADTAIFDVALPASTMSGGNFQYLVEVSDGTDFQTMSGIVAYAAEDKAGVKVYTIGELGTPAKAVSAGTLTLSWTFVTGTSKGTVKLQPTSSLTSTTPVRVTFFVSPIRGAITIV